MTEAQVDADILRRLAENDLAARDECFLYIKQWAIGQGLGLQDADDLAQETLVEAWRSRERFRGKSEVSTWLVGIAKNLLSNRRRHDKLHAPPAESIEAVGGDPGRNLDYDTAALYRMEIQTALATLTEEERRVLLLGWEEGLTSKEVSERLGKTANACRLAKARALRKLGEYRRKLGA